jgi:hypothetical protein
LSLSPINQQSLGCPPRALFEDIKVTIKIPNNIFSAHHIFQSASSIRTDVV